MIDHNFEGPAFTVGVEEELMILDSETLALANAIEAVLEPADARQVGGDPSSQAPVGEPVYTPEEEARLVEHLRDLGYE